MLARVNTNTSHIVMHCLSQAGEERTWDKNGKQGTAAIARSIATGRGAGRTRYLQANMKQLDPIAAAVLLDIRHRLGDGWIPEAREITDYNSLAMAFLGREDCYTPLHCDQASAANYAAALMEDHAVSKAGLATWDCINPQSVPAADQWLKDKAAQGYTGTGRSKGNWERGLAGGVFLGEEDLQALEQFLGDGSVMRLVQVAGTVVRIPPGWVHQVYNTLPCMKVAAEEYHLVDAGAYALLQLHILPLFGGALPDYMAVNQVVGVALRR